MKLIDIVQKLNALAEKLYKHSDRLTHQSVIESADKFLKAFMKFDNTINSFIKGEQPDAIELKTLMMQYFCTISDTTALKMTDSLGNFSKKVLGKKVSASRLTDDEYLLRIFDEIVKKDKVAFALMLIKKMNDTSIIDYNANDEISLLEQIKKLGALDDDSLDIEKQRLISNVALLYKLADAAKIKYKLSCKADTIFKKLVAEGKRYHENTGLFEVCISQK